MTLRDMTPDELELFEEEIVLASASRDRDPRADERLKGSRKVERQKPSKTEERAEGEVTPEDDDGLPDGPAKFRVPS